MVTVINDTVGVMVSVAVDYVNCFGGYCIGEQQLNFVSEEIYVFLELWTRIEGKIHSEI